MTAFFHFSNRPKSAWLKGFRWFSFSFGADTVYAPKAGALPTGRHLEILNFFGFLQKSMSVGLYVVVAIISEIPSAEITQFKGIVEVVWKER